MPRADLQTIDAKLRGDPAEFRKALFVHPEKALPVSKTKEVETENRRMLTHYGAEDGKDRDCCKTLKR